MRNKYEHHLYNREGGAVMLKKSGYIRGWNDLRDHLQDRESRYKKLLNEVRVNKEWSFDNERKIEAYKAKLAVYKDLLYLTQKRERKGGADNSK